MSDSSDESIEEETGFQRKCLDVELPDDFDPTIVPQTGYEYVQLVMYERQNTKKVVSAKIDSSKLTNNDCKLEVLAGCQKPAKSLLPSLEWQTDKIKEFTLLRQTIENQLKREPSKYFTNRSHWEDKLTQIPCVEEISDYREDCKLKLIEMIVNDTLSYVKRGEGIKYETGLWLYSLLAALQIPLHHDSHHILRDLCRKIAEIRSALKDDCAKDVVVPLNLIICLVARFFGQLDLAD